MPGWPWLALGLLRIMLHRWGEGRRAPWSYWRRDGRRRCCARERPAKKRASDCKKQKHQKNSSVNGSKQS